MPGIYPMAALTILCSALLWGGCLYVLSGRARRYLWLLLPGLPLSALANLWIKRPLATSVSQVAGVGLSFDLAQPVWLLIFLWLLSPLVEEAVKLLPLLLPPVRSYLTGDLAALWTGMGLGISFGLGEAAYLAYGVAQSPLYASLPWYMFTGYFGERLLVCLVHGVMTAVAVYGLRKGRRQAILAYLVAVGMHALVNAGAVLFQLGLISGWATQASLLASMILLLVVFERLRCRAIRTDASAQLLADEIVYFTRNDPDQANDLL